MKSIFRVVVFTFALLLLSAYFTPQLRAGFAQLSGTVVFSAKRLSTAFVQGIDEYFRTVATIKHLREENEKLRKYKLLYEALRSDYSELLSLQNSDNLTASSLIVRINSYEKLGLHTRFFASANFMPSKPVGLVANGDAIGVMMQKDGAGYAIALQDKSCAIAAKIGTQPAIVRGDGEGIWADFVEDYALINPGAAVLTSGMDGIFPAGIFIAKVEHVEQSGGYLRAKLSGAQVLQRYRFVRALLPEG